MGNALSTTCSMKSLIFSGVVIWEWKKRSSYLERSVRLQAGLKKFFTRGGSGTGGLWTRICSADHGGRHRLNHLTHILASIRRIDKFGDHFKYQLPFRK